MPPKKNTASKKPADPRRVVISQDEFNNGVTDLDNVQVGVEELQTHGFVIIENAVAADVVEKLESQMQIDAATSLTFPDLIFNHGNERNNFSITPPLSEDFIFEDIWANRHAVDIMQQIIGSQPILCWASSNIALQSSADARQTVHSDAYADIHNFPYSIEMNIYLENTTPENGSTEIWPGSHIFTEDAHLPSGRGCISKKAFTERARTSPPIQPTFPAGSILLRDLRLWHSGMPNATANPRVVVGFLYFPQWFRPLMRLTLPESVRPKAELWTHIDLLTNTDFVEGPIDHLHTRFPMNFTQDPAKAMVPYRRGLDVQQGRAPGAAIRVTKDHYWTPSKYQTRKRKRQEGGEGGEAEEEQARTKPKRKTVKKKKLEQAAETEVNPMVEAMPEPEANLALEGEEEEEVEKKTEISIGLSQNNQGMDDLPDYVDSPSYPTWIQKLQEKAVQVEVAAQDARITAVQRATFNLSSNPFAGSGPGISPKFSPKTIFEFSRSSNLTQNLKIEEQVYKNLYKLPTVPSAKMTPSPKPQWPLAKPVTKAQVAWERDPRPYKGTRPPTPKSSPLGSLFKSLAPLLSNSQPVEHVSPYCASRTVTASSSHRSDPTIQHGNPILIGPMTKPESSKTPATDAYDAYFQAQLDEKEAQELKRVEVAVALIQNIEEEVERTTNEDVMEKERLWVVDHQQKDWAGN